MMEAVRNSETSVYFNVTTRRYIAQNSKLVPPCYRVRCCGLYPYPAKILILKKVSKDVFLRLKVLEVGGGHFRRN
jgi:hypothetical protein